MPKYNWIENIDFQKVSTPITVKQDRDYFPNLTEKLCTLISELKLNGASEKIVTALKVYVEKVINSIELYYQGNLVDAQLIINQMIADFGDTAPAVTDINGSIAFPGGGPDFSEVQFFRARLSENVVEFSADDMLHSREVLEKQLFSFF